MIMAPLRFCPPGAAGAAGPLYIFVDVPHHIRMCPAGLELLHQMMPYLAGRLTLANFTALALALGAIPDPAHPVRDPHLDSKISLLQILEEENFNVCAMARRLGVCTKTIYRRLAAIGMPITDLRSADSLRTARHPS